MVPNGRKRVLVFNHDRPLLRTYVMLLEHYGYKVAAADSLIQMILKLEAEEDYFDLLFVECSSALKENPMNFVRFVRETQASSHPALILSGIGASDVLRAAKDEGMSVAIKPDDINQFLSLLAAMVNGKRGRLADWQSA